MVKAKADQEPTKIRKVDVVAALAYRAASAAMRPGTITQELDRTIENMILESSVVPSFKSLYGFPVVAYISIDPVVVYDIPGDTVLRSEDTVSVDIGARYQGYHGDSAWAYGVGKLSEEDQRLMCVSEEPLYGGLKVARAGNHLIDISYAIGEYVFIHGYSIPRDCAGHGIGASVHEDLTAPDFGLAGRGILLQEDMILAVEPAVHVDRPQTRMLKDDWGVVTRDGSKIACLEHTVVIASRGYEVPTALDKEERSDDG